MNAVANAKSNLPNLKNDGRMHVHLSGNHFQQNVVFLIVTIILILIFIAFIN